MKMTDRITAYVKAHVLQKNRVNDVKHAIPNDDGKIVHLTGKQYRRLQHKLNRDEKRVRETLDLLNAMDPLPAETVDTLEPLDSYSLEEDDTAGGSMERDFRADIKADLEKLSKAELYREAQEYKVPGRSKMDRDELIAALVDAYRDGQPS